MIHRHRSTIEPRALASITGLGLSLLLTLASGCGDDASEPNQQDDAGGDAGKDAGPKPGKDAGPKPDKDAGPKPGKDAGVRDSGADPDGGRSYSGLVVDTTPAKQDLDLFGEPGHRFWLEVNDEQLQLLNSGGGGEYGDIYVPVVSGSFADHVIVQDAKSGSVADYGKMEIKLVGESTHRQWTNSSIPNVHIDADEFQMKARIGSFEHFRLNNSIVGSIFREQIAHRIFRSLGYPALRASYAFLGSNVWGDGAWVPMTLIEMYKLRFCDDNEELLGGTCENMWEFPGDLGPEPTRGGGYPGGFPGGIPIDDKPAQPGGDPYAEIPENYCQVKTCDNTRLAELSDLLNTTASGPGFADALAKHIDWKRFHQFQCLNWILWIGDDPLHNSNNNLIIQRDDGKMVWAPYSVDISAGQDWYENTPLTGKNSIARGCQSDPECWADTIATCETLIEKFDKLNPEKFVDQTSETLTELDMMRSGDLGRAKALRAWYVQRQEELERELDRYRSLPNKHGECEDGLEPCPSIPDPYGEAPQYTCGTAAQCVEWRCPIRAAWCDALDACIALDRTCPQCEGDTPFYCPNTESCTESIDVCSLSCGTNAQYCETYGECVPFGECPDGTDGGVDDPGGIGGKGGEPGPRPNPQ